MLFHGCTPPSMAFLGFGIVTAPWPLAHPTTSTDKTTNAVVVLEDMGVTVVWPLQVKTDSSGAQSLLAI